MLSAASLLLVKEEENALPWRLTPICHSSSITDHPAAPELGCRLQPAPPGVHGRPRPADVPINSTRAFPFPRTGEAAAGHLGRIPAVKSRLKRRAFISSLAEKGNGAGAKLANVIHLTQISSAPLD